MSRKGIAAFYPQKRETTSFPPKFLPFIPRKGEPRVKKGNSLSTPLPGRPGLNGTNFSKNFQFVFCYTKLNGFSIFCTNITGNFFLSSYIFSEFIYVNPVINHNFFNDWISFCRTGKRVGVTWDTSVFFYFLAIMK